MPWPWPKTWWNCRATHTNALATFYDSTVNANKNRQNSAVFGRARLIETLLAWELWDELQALGKTMYLEPTDLPEEQLKRIHALGLAAFGKGDTGAGKAWLKELESILKTQRQTRYTDADKAEEKARAEKKPEDQVSKAMADAMQSHAERIKATERAIAELRLFEALARKDKEAARKLAEDTKEISRNRLSRVWLQLGDQKKAVKMAKELVDGATNQVQVLANYVDILWRSGKTNEAIRQFERLRPLCAKASLDVPVMKRLKPMVKHLNLPEDWRPEFKPSTDVGQRPSLDALGPFRWHPSPAPAFTLEGVDGKKVSLKDYRKKPVLVIFYLGHGCKHCLEQLNAFAPASEKFDKAGISILAVSTDSVSGLQKTFLQSASGDGFPFPIVSDPSLTAFKQYRAFDDFENTPLHGTFLVDRDGLIRWQDISYDPFTEIDFLLKESQRLLKLPVKDLPAKSPAKVASVPNSKPASKVAETN
jgi:peroxiredoxin